MKLAKEESSSGTLNVQILEVIKRSVGARKQSGLHMITKKGLVCLSEKNLNINIIKITVSFHNL